MKLTVDIPDDVYEHLKSTKTIETTDYDIVSLYRAIKNGTPYEERPQGEWIRQGFAPYGTCNICGELCEINNFCGNCGADMRGGAE